MESEWRAAIVRLQQLVIALLALLRCCAARDVAAVDGTGGRSDKGNADLYVELMSLIALRQLQQSSLK